MPESKVHFFSSEPVVALLGNPNCGKTALFNLLTGSRQKVANYSGVTVERKEGRLTLESGKIFVFRICLVLIVFIQDLWMNV